MDASGASDRRVVTECLVDGEKPAVMHGRDQVVILRLQPHDVSLQIGYAAIQVANLLKQARVTASKVP
jgi:hypothetical protein